MKLRLMTVACLLASVGFIMPTKQVAAYWLFLSGEQYLPWSRAYLDLHCSLDIEPTDTRSGYPDSLGEPGPGQTTFYEVSTSVCWFVNPDGSMSPVLSPDRTSVYSYNNAGQYVDYVYAYWGYGNLIPDAKVCWYFEGNQELGYEASVMFEDHNLGSGFCGPF